MDDDKTLAKSIVDYVRSRSGVCLGEIQAEFDNVSPVAVGKTVYCEAYNETIVLVENEGTHWFFAPEQYRKYTLTAMKHGETRVSVKTDDILKLMDYVRACIDTGAAELEILTNPEDPRARARSDGAQDLDIDNTKPSPFNSIKLPVVKKVNDKKDCDCVPNLHDCKNWSCPRA